MAAVNKSAKRQLYKPALSGSVPREPKARPLAQGILADSNISWQDELMKSTSALYSDDVMLTSHKKKERPKIVYDDEAKFSNKKRSPLKEHVAVTEEMQESIDTLYKPSLYRNEVLVVDASGPCLNPESSEVTITEHKVFSPAKVICHSPSPERQKRSFELDNITGKYDLKVESPAQIVFGTAGSTHNSTNESAENSKDSTEKSSTIDSKQQETKSKMKKKSTRVVQSRYMNPKEPKKKQEDAATKTKPAMHSFIHDISAIQSHSIREGSTKAQGAKKKKSKVTSTPFRQSFLNEKTRMVADGSYLDISKNVTTGPPEIKHELIKTAKENKEKHVQGKLAAGDLGRGIGVHEHHEPVNEKQLQMLYCRMLQAMFLNAKAKDTFTKQEKEAKEQIYNVWQNNQRLKAEIWQLEQSCMAKKHAMILDQLLKIQDAGLKPIDESLDKLHNNYLTMGEALDNTRHYMPVEDIVIGDEEKLISALKESQMLLAEISSYTGMRESGIEQMATDLNHMVDKFHSEIVELSRCQELLKAANSKTSHERSLQSQILQSKQPF